MALKKIWITWEHQLRNWEVAEGLGAKYFEFSDLARTRYCKKYLIGPIRTIKTIWKEKPAVVFCENPSFVLALTVVILKKVFKYKAVVDTHNDGLMIGRGRILALIGKFLQRFADITIVTNPELAKFVKKNQGTPFILPDRIPNIKPIKLNTSRDCVLYICTFANDEPYISVFEAARLLPHVIIVVTGNHQKKQIQQRFSVPDNVILIGYLPRQQYETQLYTASVIMALSTYPNCLLCGNYEAVSVEKPLVTTDDRSIKNHFNEGTVYCNNTPTGIAAAITVALQRQDELTKEMKLLKARLTLEWSALAQNLLQVVHVDV